MKDEILNELTKEQLLKIKEIMTYETILRQKWVDEMLAIIKKDENDVSDILTLLSKIKETIEVDDNFLIERVLMELIEDNKLIIQLEVSKIKRPIGSIL